MIFHQSFYQSLMVYCPEKFYTFIAGHASSGMHDVFYTMIGCFLCVDSSSESISKKYFYFREYIEIGVGVDNREDAQCQAQTFGHGFFVRLFPDRRRHVPRSD